MKKIVVLIVLLALALGLVSCGAGGNNIAGEYSLTPGLISIIKSFNLNESDKLVLASDGTGSLTGSDSTSTVLFEWAFENNKLLLKNFIGRTFLCDITVGKEFSTLKINDPDMEGVEFVLEKTAAAPKSAFNKSPDPSLLIGCFSDRQHYYSFYKNGVFRYEDVKDYYHSFQCLYEVNGNKLTIGRSKGVYVTGETPYYTNDLVLYFNVSEKELTILGPVDFRSSNSLAPGTFSRSSDSGSFDSESYDLSSIFYYIDPEASEIEDYQKSITIIKDYDYFSDLNERLKIIGSEAGAQPFAVFLPDWNLYSVKALPEVQQLYSKTFNYYGKEISNGVLIPVYSYGDNQRVLIAFDIDHVYDVSGNLDGLLYNLKSIINDYRSGSLNIGGNTAPDPSNDTPQPNTGMTVAGYARVLIDDLNIRTAPNTSAKIKGLAKQYKEYEVYNITTAGGYTWYQIGQDEWVADDGSWISFSTERRGSTDKPITPYEEFFGDWSLFYKDSGHYYSSNSSGLRIYKDGTWIKHGSTSAIGGNWKSISNDTLALLLDENGDGKADETYQVRLFTVYHENELDNKNTLSPYEPGTGDTPFCMLTEENGEYYYYTKPDKSAQTPAPANAVYVSIYQNHSLVKAKDGSPVDMYPVEIPKNGATIKEIIIQIHKELCPDGENGCAFADTPYGEAITKLWGIDNGGYYSYSIDDALADSVSEIVSPNQFLDLFIE